MDKDVTKNIDKFIEDLWEQTKKDLPIKNWPKFDVDQALEDADARNDKRQIPEVDAWLRIYDEFLSWYVWFTIQLYIALGKSEKDEEKERSAVFVSIFSVICADMFAIRRLVSAGLDVPAKQILRSFREYCEVAVFLSIRTDLIKEFRNTEEAEDSNKFWHKHLSRGRARKAVRNFKNKILKKKDFDFDHYDWEDEDDGILSMASHPSFLAGFVSMFSSFEEELDWEEFSIRFFGAKNEASVRTLSYPILFSFDVLSIFFYNLFRKEDPLFKLDEEDEILQYIFKGRPILLSIILHLVILMNENKDSEGRNTKDILKWFSN